MAILYAVIDKRSDRSWIELIDYWWLVKAKKKHAQTFRHTGAGGIAVQLVTGQETSFAIAVIVFEVIAGVFFSAS